MKHYATCNANYPEKVEGEAPQSTTDVNLGDGTVARTCNDCGAYEIVSLEEEPMSIIMALDMIDEVMRKRASGYFSNEEAIKLIRDIITKVPHAKV